MKMKIRWTPLLSLVLVVWTLFSGYLLLQVGDRYIGKDYFDSMDLEYSMDEFIQEIGPVVLNPVDPEAMKSKLTVSQDEIDEHRYQYGDLGEQLENIRQQYEARIDEAEVNNATDLEKKLIAERDAKIKDITLNFESDEHVKKKILTEKEKQVDTYISELQAYKNQLLKDYDYIAFDLTNVETGEHFTTGDINDSALLIKEYKGTAKLKTWSISEKLLEQNDLYLINALYSRNYNSKNQESKSVNKSYEYTGQVMIPESTFNINYGGDKGDRERFERNSIIYSIIWLSGFITLILVLTLYRPKLEDYLVSNKLKDRLTSWTLDIQVVVLGLTWVFFCELMENAYMPIETVNYQNKVSVIFNLILGLSLMFVFGVLFLLQLVWVYDRVKTWDQLTKEVQSSMLWKLGYSTKDLFLNRGIGVQSLILISAAFFGGIGLISSWYSGGMSVLLCFVCIIIGIPSLLVFLSRMGYMNRIMKATAELAEGRLTGEIKVKGNSPFAQHAQNINKLREGVRNSMNEQAKSERLKTELITNVSHDLRTPLTSIITYTDLLKNPDITEEERKQYIDVLDKKSARLKTLIEDLFEVSKMASGNIELHKQRVDLSQLVKQAVGEHEEDLTKARLDLRMSIPDTMLFAYVDGQKWWRVIDNLIVNVLKYSLEGTRVYVTLKRTVDGDAELIVKNVAKYEMSENVDELFERFKRADASRHTDGSGLGLAIAQSIVDLHNGRMSIEVDGDLFKVIVTVPAI